MQIIVLVFLCYLFALSVVSVRWMFAFSLVFFAFEVALEGTLEIFKSNLTLANYIVGFTTLLSISKSLPAQERPLSGYLNPVLFLTIIIFGWSILSLIWSPALSNKFDTGSNIIISLWPQFILTVILTPLLLRHIEDWKNVLPIFIFVGGAICLMILLNPEFTFKNARIGADLPGGLRTSPLAIGQVGGMIVLVGGLYLPSKNNVVKILYRVTCFLLGAWLALSSGSRGQILFAAILIVVFYPMSRKIKNLRSFATTVLGLALLAIVGSIIFEATSETEFNRWSDDAISRGANIRYSFIFKLLSAFSTAPVSWIIGLGFNAFSSFGEIYGQGYSHCTSVDILTELGFPMFVAYVAALYLTVRSCIALFKHYQDDPSMRAAVAVLVSMFTYQFMLANKEGNLWSSTNLFLFMIIIVKFDMNSKTESIQTETDVLEAYPEEHTALEYRSQS